MLELLAGTGLGLASHIMESSFDSAMNDHYDEQHQLREFNLNQKTMKSQQIRELQNLQNAPSAYVQGLKKAGVNPALLASGQVPVGQSTALPTSGSGHAIPGTSGALNAASAAVMAKKQSDLLSSEVELNKSTAAKNRADAAATNLETQHGESADVVVNASMREFLTQIQENTDNEFIKNYLSDMLSSSQSFDVGSLRGFSSMFFDFSRNERERELEFIANEMDKKVLRARYNDDRIAEALANRPYDERIQMYKQMALMNMQIYSMAADASLTENKRELLDAQAKYFAQQARALYHNDPAAMWDANDYGAYANRLVNAGIESAANGFGFGVGAALAHRFGGKSSDAMRTRLEVGEDMAKTQTQVFQKAMKQPQPKQLQVAQLRKQLEKMKSDGTKYTKPEVYRKKLDELMRAKYGM